ncbi:hypothetical protein J7E24_14995 [Hymenobacter sp. ISL-91]|uniref:hypothetical protein n=1 Tax=Hymenobacter sp. ISL-91 TaxID=2819151 RepID=UPI001BE86514|nr:hypothetical protein [Hymenobacter sp. ISL-91]MBT2559096.1 hypothetical protein [Hymenobacter sp. ISL-91]
MLKNLPRALMSLLLLGAAAWLHGFFMPAFIEGKSINNLYEIMYTADPADEVKNTQSDGAIDYRKTYYAAEKAWRTNRNDWLDTGSGVAISSLTVLLFLRANRVQSWKELRRTKTVSKTRFFVWLNVGWALLFVALYWYYYYRGFRGDFPPFADSIGIPLMYGQAALLMGWLVSNALFLLALWPAQLPALLFEQPRHYARLTVLVEAVVFLPLMFASLYAVFSVLDGDHLTIPVALLFVYLLLVLRAGYMRAINKR